MRKLLRKWLGIKACEDTVINYLLATDRRGVDTKLAAMTKAIADHDEQWDKTVSELRQKLDAIEKTVAEGYLKQPDKKAEPVVNGHVPFSRRKREYEKKHAGLKLNAIGKQILDNAAKEK